MTARMILNLMGPISLEMFLHVLRLIEERRVNRLSIWVSVAPMHHSDWEKIAEV